MAMRWESTLRSVGCAAAGLNTNRNRSQGRLCVSGSAEQNTKFSSCANDYPEQGAGPQHHFANEHQQTCKFKLAHCPDPPVYTHSSVVQYLEDTVWLIRGMILWLKLNTEGFVSPHTALATCLSVLMQQFAWAQTNRVGGFRKRCSVINGEKALTPLYSKGVWITYQATQRVMTPVDVANPTTIIYWATSPCLRPCHNLHPHTHTPPGPFKEDSLS